MLLFASLSNSKSTFMDGHSFSSLSDCGWERIFEFDDLSNFLLVLCVFENFFSFSKNVLDVLDQQLCDDATQTFLVCLVFASLFLEKKRHPTVEAYEVANESQKFY